MVDAGTVARLALLQVLDAGVWVFSRQVSWRAVPDSMYLRHTETREIGPYVAETLVRALQNAGFVRSPLGCDLPIVGLDPTERQMPALRLVQSVPTLVDLANRCAHGRVELRTARAALDTLCAVDARAAALHADWRAARRDRTGAAIALARHVCTAAGLEVCPACGAFRPPLPGQHGCREDITRDGRRAARVARMTDSPTYSQRAPAAP